MQTGRGRGRGGKPPLSAPTQCVQRAAVTAAAAVHGGGLARQARGEEKRTGRLRGFLVFFVFVCDAPAECIWRGGRMTQIEQDERREGRRRHNGALYWELGKQGGFIGWAGRGGGVEEAGRRRGRGAWESGPRGGGAFILWALVFGLYCVWALLGASARARAAAHAALVYWAARSKHSAVCVCAAARARARGGKM